MNNPRIYGTPPFTVVVVHGGPGAPGTMAPVARELASSWGVLEPLQTARSLEDQILELRHVVASQADTPVALIGSSWGGMLSFIVAARFPDLVRKLILIGSGVFEDRYAAGIDAERFRRLDDDERRAVNRLIDDLNNPAVIHKNTVMAGLGHLFTRTDAFDPLTLDTEVIEVQFDIFQAVWAEMVAYRASGALLELGRQIRCPVVAIHGDYDPHPAEGIREPLSTVLSDFRFILLDQCGHLPWIERRAKDRFYRILNQEIGLPE